MSQHNGVARPCVFCVRLFMCLVAKCNRLTHITTLSKARTVNNMTSTCSNDFKTFTGHDLKIFGLRVKKIANVVEVRTNTLFAKISSVKGI